MKTPKSLYWLALTAALALAFTGCKKDDDASRPGNLTIEKTEYTLDADEERTATVAFTATADWTLSVAYDDAESSADWLTVTPTSGTAGEQTVELSAARNFRASARTAYADLVCGEQSVRLTVTQTAASDATDFTAQFDPDFAKELQKQGIIADAEHITPEDMEKIAAITSLDVSGTEDAPGALTSLQGIEYFESLTDLECEYNRLTSLDVSANTKLWLLSCSNNSLKKLNVSANSELITLHCEENQLTELDVSTNTKLSYLYGNDNQLTSLDISANSELTYLYCYDNQLSSLDVSANPELIIIWGSNNSLTELDVRANTKLTDFSCSNNSLTELDVRANTELEMFNCSNNSLTSLDVSANTKLTWYFYCGGNQLTSLDVSNCTALGKLYCYDNQLTSLDVSRNTALTNLVCYSNQLTELDVSQNTMLTSLQCHYNQLTTLDVSRNTALTQLYCSYNPGDGVSSFPITAWFDNDTKPDNLEIDRDQWTYDGKTITIDFRKAE